MGTEVVLLRSCAHCPVVLVGRGCEVQPVDVVNVANIITVLPHTVLCHGVPVSPGVGHVVEQLEDPGQDGRQEKERGGGGESRGEAEKPDGASEPGGQLQEEVLQGERE